MHSFHAFGYDWCWRCGSLAALKLCLPDDDCSLWTLPPAVESSALERGCTVTLPHAGARTSFSCRRWPTKRGRPHNDLKCMFLDGCQVQPDYIEKCA